MGFELEFLHVLEKLHNPLLDKIMLFITKLGDNSIVWQIICWFLILVPPMKMIISKGDAYEYEEEIAKRRRVGWSILVSTIISTTFVDYVLKGVFRRPRPFYVDPTLFFSPEKISVMLPSATSFPSGHTAVAFASAFLIFATFKKTGILAIILACLIAFSRMYFFLHYPTDILGGIVVGAIIALIANAFGKEMAR